VKEGLLDVNITRTGEKWGVRVPWDESFYDLRLVRRPADLYHPHRIRQRRRPVPKMCPPTFLHRQCDITRLSLRPLARDAQSRRIGAAENGLWPWLVYKKTEEGVLEKFSKSLGTSSSRWTSLRNSPGSVSLFLHARCPFPGDGEFSWQRFADVYNAELANNSQSFTAVW